jgi:hypothetical protein
VSVDLLYLDTSVVLAQLLAEDVIPPESIWGETLISSRLLQYETWIRVHARGLSESHGHLARELLSGIAMVELVEPVLPKVLEPFPRPVRTLDALHLASILFLNEQGQEVRLATYDGRMRSAAEALGVPIYPL